MVVEFAVACELKMVCGVLVIVLGGSYFRLPAGVRHLRPIRGGETNEVGSPSGSIPSSGLRLKPVSRGILVLLCPRCSWNLLSRDRLEKSCKGVFSECH